jgi:hypothetical protein
LVVRPPENLKLKNQNSKLFGSGIVSIPLIENIVWKLKPSNNRLQHPLSNVSAFMKGHRERAFLAFYVRVKNHPVRAFSSI